MRMFFDPNAGTEMQGEVVSREPASSLLVACVDARPSEIRTMSRSFERLVAAVEEFHNWVQLPRLGNLSPKLMFEFTPESVWADPYKVDAGLPGCYVFEDDEGDLYYVGSVSANSGFGYRFANGYLCKDPEDKTKIKRSGWLMSARRIYFVDLPRDIAVNACHRRFGPYSLASFRNSSLLPAPPSRLFV